MSFELVPVIEDGVLKTNAGLLIEEVRKELAKYSYLVQTKDDYRHAKEDRATLNSMVKQLQASRKLIEDQVFASWKTDKSNIMQIEKDIKAAADRLGQGIAALDDADKAEKAKWIETKWNELGGTMYCFADVLAENRHWLNKTAKEAVIAAEINSILNELKKQRDQISRAALNLPMESREMVMARWSSTRSFGECMNLVTEITESIRKAQEREQLKKAQDVVPPKQQMQAQPEPVYRPEPEPAQQTTGADPHAQSEPVQTVSVKFMATGRLPALKQLIYAAKQMGIQLTQI